MLSLGLLTTQITFAQNTPQFTGISVTDEGAMHLAWASISNELYEIDEAEQLAGYPGGTTTWNELYNDYPSQGTNTFWLDTGNYFNVPPILNPNDMPMRFYRILDQGPDTTSDEPSVSITSPTNNTTTSGELTITVFASTDQPVLSGTKLYVDGQEMPPADSTTNYADSSGVTNYELDTYNINTCEWGDEAHILFATTACESGFGDPLNAPAVMFGHAVSAFIPVTFNNLVTRISFSQPFFDPSSGQTQQVSAVFPLNSDWTLNIVDVNSNVVQTATGSGMSMLYDWDGTDNGTNLPNGIYYYYITAQTNGESDEIVIGGSGGSSGGSPPSPDFTMSSSGSDSSELWAVTPGSEDVVPLALYPPDFDTNSLTIFAASPSEVQSLISSCRSKSTLAMSTVPMDSGDTVSSDYTGITPLPNSQSAPSAPQRPPNNPVKGVAGQFGVAYQDYSFSGLTLPTPLNGLPVIPGQNPQHVQLNGDSGTSGYCAFLETVEFDDFITQMKRGAWQTGFVKANSQLHASDLQGSGTPFNQFSLGLLSLHGAYATSVDYNANQSKPTYVAIDGRPNNISSWVGMYQMNFGASGTNGLKWMAILSCNALQQENWNSMQNSGITPFNGNLHLLLGANSTCDNGNLIIWATFMLGLDYNTARPIMQAWQNSAPFCAHHPVSFAVAGYDDCEADMLTGTNSTTPAGNIVYQAFAPQ